ncbi:AMIN-like domain-containing (lipo)protein [Streptomyces sp. NPDC002394]
MRLTRRALVRIFTPLAAVALLSLLVSPTASAAETRTASVTATCSHTCVLGTRAATHTGYDRLVFDLTSSTQVTTSTNTTGAYTPWSGKTEFLEVRGTSYLFITMEDTDVYDDAGNLTFASPTLQSFNLPALKGVQLLQAFDNRFDKRVEFGITLGPSTSYQIFQLTQPNRLVVDIYQ